MLGERRLSSFGGGVKIESANTLKGLKTLKDNTMILHCYR
jgi:hypothetical protein